MVRADMEYMSSLLNGLTQQEWPWREIIIGVIALIIVLRLLGGGLTKTRAGRKSRRQVDITKCRNVIYQSLNLMSHTEFNFWLLLRKALPECHIFPQIATSALLTVQTDNRSLWWDILRRYNTTRIDFVICDSNLAVLALVELDDQSHDQKKSKDRERDYITSQAGYRTVRFDCRNWPDSARIRKELGLYPKSSPQPSSQPQALPPSHLPGMGRL